MPAQSRRRREIFEHARRRMPAQSRRRRYRGLPVVEVGQERVLLVRRRHPVVRMHERLDSVLAEQREHGRVSDQRPHRIVEQGVQDRAARCLLDGRRQLRRVGLKLGMHRPEDCLSILLLSRRFLFASVASFLQVEIAVDEPIREDQQDAAVNKPAEQVGPEVPPKAVDHFPNVTAASDAVLRRAPGRARRSNAMALPSRAAQPERRDRRRRLVALAAWRPVSLLDGLDEPDAMHVLRRGPRCRRCGSRSQGRSARGHRRASSARS